MVYVNFNRTKPASFALSEYADRNTIYFTTDTHEVIVNGQSFGGTVDLTELWRQINAHTQEIGTLTVDLTELQKQVDAHTEEIGTLTIELSNLEATHAEEAEVIAAALNDLNKRLVQGLTSLNDIIVENELTTSAALNDLNTRLLDTIDTITIDAMFL